MHAPARNSRICLFLVNTNAIAGLVHSQYRLHRNTIFTFSSHCDFFRFESLSSARDMDYVELYSLLAMDTVSETALMKNKNKKMCPAPSLNYLNSYMYCIHISNRVKIINSHYKRSFFACNTHILHKNTDTHTHASARAFSTKRKNYKLVQPKWRHRKWWWIICSGHTVQYVFVVPGGVYCILWG